MLTVDLIGRVDRISLPLRNSLYPLFEAISNSIHAIQAVPRDDGVITVEIRRDPSQGRLALQAEATDQISEIEIRDNGVGFTDENLAAFEELDTRFKLNLGGKGVGRLVWLKTFDRVSVESVYQAETGYRRRAFAFVLPGGVEEIDDRPLTDGTRSRLETRVTMSGPREDYRDALRHRASTIAAMILRHFLSYLLAPRAPRIEVSDGDEVIPVELTGVTGRTTSEFAIRDHHFKVEHLKIGSPEKRQHLAHYCANGRTVKDEQLKQIPPARLRDAEDDFFYHAYVSSPYLDARVNEQRTAFAIDEDAELSEVSFRELRAEVHEAAMQYLKPQLSQLAEERDARVNRVLEQRMPELHYVRDQNAEEISRISLTATEREVEEELGRIHLQNQKTGRELLTAFVEDVKQSASIDLTTFMQSFGEHLSRITRPSQANLASYLLFRHSIIEIYRQLLRKAGDRFQLEAAIHRLLLPMQADFHPSHAPVDHNLWLIDERLTYATYIASDQPLSRHKVLFGVEDKDEPDIVAYFNLGFSSDDPSEGPLQSVVIVELKRPGPLKKRDENPWQQVMRYIDRIREGFNVEGGGQKIKAVEGTRFYCYIVCDLDSDVVKHLIDDFQFTPLFDGSDGYFLYNGPRKAYVELIPFEKVLRDVQRRHRAFFERLGITPNS
jgi:anti-sigma regulatory factor (Ser/Thr protein kinase)